MNNGDCYSIGNATTIYRYPTLSCTEGGNLPGVNDIRRDTFIRGEDGIYRQSQSQNNYDYNSSTTSITTHLWDDSPFLRIPASDYVLPATLVMLAFFWVIFAMIRGLRR